MSTAAIHVIWTNYMTWPPGDARGHWSPLFDFYGRLIARGDRLNLPDPTTRAVAIARAKEPEKVFTRREQEIVARTVGLILRDDFEGRVAVYAAAIERTHTHLLLGPTTIDLDKLVGRIKSRTSSAVIHDGDEPWRTRTWTTGYWHVFMFDIRSIPDVQVYIERHNTRRGLPPAPYPWITPFR